MFFRRDHNRVDRPTIWPMVIVATGIIALIVAFVFLELKVFTRP